MLLIFLIIAVIAVGVFAFLFVNYRAKYIWLSLEYKKLMTELGDIQLECESDLEYYVNDHRSQRNEYKKGYYEGRVAGVKMATQKIESIVKRKASVLWNSKI